jgi:predicted HicB family RNase H-like nuclease
MIVECYAERHESGQWEALCLDFDIAVQGDSFADVEAKLCSAVREYLEYVQALPEPEQKKFLARRAPLKIRLKILLHEVVNLLAKNFERKKERYSYTVPCAV